MPVKYNWFVLLLIFLSGVLMIFIVGPILNIFLHEDLKSVFFAFSEKEVQESIWRTLLLAFLATLIFSFFCIPLAYLLAKKKFFGKTVISSIIDMPIVIPHSAAGIAVLGFVAPNSVVGKFSQTLGLSFIGTPAGIVIAMAFVSVPFLINAARDGFVNVPERLEKSALNLGASPIFVFFTISLPLAWRSILSGFILMFGRGMSEFGAVVIIAYHPMTVPVMIFERFTAFGLSYARPLTLIFVSICLLVFILLRQVSITKHSPKTIYAEGPKLT